VCVYQDLYSLFCVDGSLNGHAYRLQCYVGFVAEASSKVKVGLW
jgi:hypothetical protein